MNKASLLYEIRVRGHLSPRRLDCFEDLTIRQQPDGEMVLVGPFRDQSALYGLLNWLQNVGVPLLSVRWLRDGDVTEEAEMSEGAELTADGKGKTMRELLT